MVPSSINRSGLVIVDSILAGAIILQGVSYGLSPNTTAAINSLALLGIAAISAWTAAKTSAIKKVADATHTLSNSAMGAQLLANVQNLEALGVLAHRFAQNGVEADIAYAAAIDVRVEAAKEEYQDHIRKQAVVDSKV
jgi:hypothetical protein